MKTAVRFPPSPTGFLHVGNARIALINYLFAKKNGSEIFLRFDDTDTARGKEEFKIQMEEDLRWLGFTFAKTFEQSKRIEIYKEIFQKLLQVGAVYACFETEEELEIKRKLQLSNGKPPIYQRTEFTQEQLRNAPYFRFQLSKNKIQWNDLIQGEMSYEGADLSDPVILRANGNFMYTFCSVVDDFLMNISHVIRGADHITNTAIQIQIFNAIAKVLGEEKSIFFAHLPLFQGKEGKISKRVGGFSIMEMRKNGFRAEAINNILAKIGLSYYEDTFQSMEDLIAKFDISKFNKAQITFDFSLLEIFNQKAISHLEYSEAKPEIPPQMTEQFFLKIRENLTFLSESFEWFDAIKNPDKKNQIQEIDKPFISELYLNLKDAESITWENLLTTVKQKFPTRKGKEIFMPIRFVLTGKTHGPEMHFIIDEMGSDLIKKRFFDSLQ